MIEDHQENRIVAFYKRNFLILEMVLAVVSALGLVIWSEFFEGYLKVIALLDGNRSTIYGALASVIGTMLGFSITAVSIILGVAESPRVALIRESSSYQTLWRIFLSSNWILGFGTLTSIIGLVFDRDRSPNLVLFYITIMFSLLAVVRVARCVWVLEKIIGIVSAPSKARRVTPINQDND